MVDTIMTAKSVSPVYSSQKRKNKKKKSKKFAGKFTRKRDDEKEKKKKPNENKNLAFGLGAVSSPRAGIDNKIIFKIMRKGDFRISKHMKNQIDLMA